ncbi:MAG: Mo-dependent nitrogenase C-terminal domain-containing protein [Cyanobacteria bacterium J06636_16]
MSFLHLPFWEPRSDPTIAPLASIRRWISAIEVHHVFIARWICRLIPNTCSATHDVRLFGRTVLSVPSLCRFNPFQDELTDLRFRAADFLYEHKRS